MIDMFDFVSANWRWLILAVIALVYFLNGLVIVRQWERVPVTRLSRYVRTLGPGLSWIEP
jgi:regulator of protease activity HflC (stomatin/prohibitin superfamily)